MRRFNYDAGFVFLCVFFSDCELTAIQLSEISVNIPESVLKRSRLIVRNLSFKVSVKSIFLKYA